jgi:hypothetical protein
MTFYEEVRAFFKKYDPARVRLAKKIAATYTTPRGQKAAMRRLKEVYAAGGPDKFDFSAGKKPAPVVSAPVEEVAAQAEEVVENIDDASDEMTEVAE